MAAFLWGQKAKSQKLDRAKIPFDTVASSGPPVEQQEHARARQNLRLTPNLIKFSLTSSELPLNRAYSATFLFSDFNT